MADLIRRAQASRRRRHLHHRPQRQLHERLRRALQLLRVLPSGRARRGLRPRRSTRSSRRSTRPSRSAACQLLLQGGHNPDLPLQWYEDLFRAVKTRYPDFKLHALSPPEVVHLTRTSKLTVAEVIARLVAAGLDSVPGGGAEILVDRVRKLLNCYGKATADEWLDVMRHAHRAGLRTTATMMYGTVETDEERLEHMLRLRALQDETGGFTAFITWSYQPEHTERGGSRGDRHRLPAHAGDRAARARQLRQPAGVVGDAGRQGRAAQPGVRRQRHGQRDDRGERRARRRRGLLHGRSRRSSATSRTPGSSPKRRSMHYDILGDPMFRQREVPRHAGAGHRARRRRHVGPGRARQLSRAQRRRQAAAHAPPPSPVGMIRLGAAWVVPDRPRRHSATAGSRSTGDRIVAVGQGQSADARPSGRFATWARWR